MISLGIIGEYIAKIYDEIKARPAYLVEDAIGLQEPVCALPSTTIDPSRIASDVAGVRHEG
jgi:dolichol-phosphate mannosyltransferase